MFKYVLIIAVIAGIFFYQKSCAPSKSSAVPFTAEWILEEADGITDTKSTEKMTIVTDGKKFRIDSLIREEMYAMAPQEGRSTTVYDGAHLYTKTATVPDPASGRLPQESPVSTQKVTDDQIFLRRFWLRSQIGNAGAGGQVAGRETLLYQARENRPEREVTIQAWVDKETGVVLKSAETIFSKQVDTVVNKRTMECRQITFGAVDATRFAKPQ
jgi:hypothetical protein